MDWHGEIRQVSLALLLSGLSFSMSAQAVTTDEAVSSLGASAASSLISAEPLRGLLVNQTMTVAGQEFFRNFAAGWRDLPVSQRYSVSIHERPSPRQGTRIWVAFDRETLFQAFLPPGRDQILFLSEQAVEMVSSSIIATDLNRAMYQEADLAADEI